VHAYNFRNSWVSSSYPKKYIAQLDGVVSTENDCNSAADGLQRKFEWFGIVFRKEEWISWEEEQQRKADL